MTIHPQMDLDMFWNELVTGSDGIRFAGDDLQIAAQRLHALPDVDGPSREFQRRIVEQVQVDSSPREHRTPSIRNPIRRTRALRFRQMPVPSASRSAAVLMLATMILGALAIVLTADSGVSRKPPGFLLAVGTTPETTPQAIEIAIPINSSLGFANTRAILGTFLHRIGSGAHPTTKTAASDCCPTLQVFTVVQGALILSTDQSSVVTDGVTRDYPAGTSITLTEGEALIVTGGKTISWANQSQSDALMVETNLTAWPSDSQEATPDLDQLEASGAVYAQAVTVPDHPLTLEIRIAELAAGQSVTANSSLALVGLITDLSAGSLGRDPYGNLFYLAGMGPGVAVTSSLVLDTAPQSAQQNGHQVSLSMPVTSESGIPGTYAKLEVEIHNLGPGNTTLTNNRGGFPSLIAYVVVEGEVSASWYTPFDLIRNGEEFDLATGTFPLFTGDALIAQESGFVAFTVTDDQTVQIAEIRLLGGSILATPRADSWTETGASSVLINVPATDSILTLTVDTEGIGTIPVSSGSYAVVAAPLQENSVMIDRNSATELEVNSTSPTGSIVKVELALVSETSASPTVP